MTLAAHPIQRQIAKLVLPYCTNSEGVVHVVHALAWNMVCVLNGTGMTHSEIMECVSGAINNASIALGEVKQREQKGKHTHGSE